MPALFVFILYLSFILITTQTWCCNLKYDSMHLPDFHCRLCFLLIRKLWNNNDLLDSPFIRLDLEHNCTSFHIRAWCQRKLAAVWIWCRFRQKNWILNPKMELIRPSDNYPPGNTKKGLWTRSISLIMLVELRIDPANIVCVAKAWFSS